MPYINPVLVRIPLQDEITVKEMQQKLLKNSSRSETQQVGNEHYETTYYDKDGKGIGKVVNREISRLFNPLGKTAPGNESYTPVKFVEADGKMYVDYDNDGILDYEEKTMEREAAMWYMHRVSWQSMKPRSNPKKSNDISSMSTSLFGSMNTNVSDSMNTDNNQKDKNSDGLFSNIKSAIF